MDKKLFLFLGILCIVVTVVLLILVIALPILRKNDAETESTEHSTPAKDNIDLWAKFPGELKTQTTHTFKILKYEDDMKSASVNYTIKLNESTKYDNFEFGNQIKFDAISTFNVIPDQTKTKNAKIKTISLGLFETLETLSNPEKYKQGINSIAHLIRKAFQSPDIFIRHLYSYKLSISLTPEEVKNLILNGVESSKQDAIVSGDSEYNLKSALGFDNWVKLLDNNEEIKNAKWLSEKFGLTTEEIDSVFGKEGYLYKQYIEFNAFLSKTFDCKNPDFCGAEIIYSQLINPDVVKYVDKNLNSISELYEKINKDYYPFEKSPELFNFFDAYKTKHEEAKDYENYKLTIEQLESLIGEKSDISLLSSGNSNFFIAKIDTKDTKSLSEKYNINARIINFSYEYIYEFLPELLLYPSFKSGEDTLKVSPFVKAYSNLVSDMIKKSYYPLSKITNVYNTVYSGLVWSDLKKEINNDSMEYDEEDLCYLFMQQVLDDGRKALKICANPVTNFKSKFEFIKWVEPYRCVMLNETGCNMTLIDELKKIVYITDNEIKSIYQTNNFGKIIYENYKALNDSLNCGDKCNDDKYLIKMQFWKSNITQSFPEGKKSDSLYDILPELVPYPMELNYYLNKKGIKNNISETLIDYLISLSPEKNDDSLCEDNYKSFNNRMEFEKDYASYINGKTNDDEIKDRIYLFDLLNNALFFDDIVYIEYENIEDYLQGNNNEDKKYLEYLSEGEYYNYHKPGLNKTTGFNFGINLITGEKIYAPYDKYVIDTEVLRKIVKINDASYMNIQKMEYNIINNTYDYVDTPILNYKSLTGDEAFIDGFQYNHEEDTIYYFDKISSGTYKYNFDEEIDYKDETCRKYILDISSVQNNKDSISEKLNKPLFITVGTDGLNTEIKEDINKENYICVEPYSNMVLESKFNFIYSIDTKNYGYLYPKIESNKKYPIFIYSKEYEVDIDSFENAFPSISSAKSFKTYFLAFGIVFIIILAVVSVFLIYRYVKYTRKRIKIDEGPENINLINDSREATLNKSDLN